ncbi:hypothetical protein J6590_038802 [Homalodisca vitripennis]|nr:hypothetical protein J6590_038802 [Homalodisca vitripennis]
MAEMRFAGSSANVYPTHKSARQCFRKRPPIYQRVPVRSRYYLPGIYIEKQSGPEDLGSVRDIPERPLSWTEPQYYPKLWRCSIEMRGLTRKLTNAPSLVVCTSICISKAARRPISTAAQPATLSTLDLIVVTTTSLCGGRSRSDRRAHYTCVEVLFRINMNKSK